MAISEKTHAAPVNGFAFEVLRTCGRARIGRITTPHGVIDTPAFMPVGTRAAVRALTPEQVAQTGAQILLCNTYHLLLRPGPELIDSMGGIQRFMGWHRPVLTDSGGYQVFSLADRRRVDDDAVIFQSHLDGAVIRLSPEVATHVQEHIGADIAMVLDECPPLPAEPDQLRGAVDRTVAWARRCRAAHRRPNQALYGIVQGGLDVGLREHCLRELLRESFDGYALGGLAVGESTEQMWSFLDAFADRLPADRPRYLMGVGAPADLVVSVAAGIDQFDCVLPTRNGRKGYAFTSTGVIRLRNAVHRDAETPLDPNCSCYTCRSFSRAYLRHLFMSQEQLGGGLVSLHNLTFYQQLMDQVRAAIRAGTFASWKDAFLADAKRGGPTTKDEP